MEDTVYSRGPVLWVRSPADQLQRLASRDLQRHFRIGPEPSTTEPTPSPSEFRDSERQDSLMSSSGLSFPNHDDTPFTFPIRDARRRGCSGVKRRGAAAQRAHPSHRECSEERTRARRRAGVRERLGERESGQGLGESGPDPGPASGTAGRGCARRWGAGSDDDEKQGS